MVDANEKWHKCAFCDRQFTKVEHLKRHQRSHTGERPFKCPKCDQRYARSDVLARHMQNHPRRAYRSKVTKQVPSPRTSLQSTSVLEDGDAQPHGGSLQPRTGTPSTTCDDPDLDGGTSGLPPPSSHPSVNATSQHNSTSNANQPEWLATPIQSANGVDQPLFGPHQTEGPDRYHPPVTDRCPTYHASSFIGHAPLSDQPIVDAWPFSTSLNPGYDFSDMNMDVALSGARLSLATAGHLLEGGPSLFEIEPPLGEMPVTNSNTFKGMDCTGQPLGPNSLKRVQQMWSGKGTSQPALLVHTLWKDIAEHKAANILSDPAEHCLPSPPSAFGSESGIESKITEQCRDRLFAFHRQTQINPGRTLDSNMPSPSDAQQGELSSGSLAGPVLPDIQFPSLEILNLSLTFYFRHVHPSLPFIHRPTLNVSETPCLLLLPIVLIGYSVLDPHGSEALVSRYRAHLIELCRVDLACKARGKSGSPSGLIRSLASSILVLYLNLEDRNREEEAALMLCAQTLHIAEKHGLYETHGSQNLIDSLFTENSDGESDWKLWARIESVKRLILSLVRMDTAYARLLGTTGVVDPNQVNIVLPANSALFDSPNADQFFQDAKMAAVAMPVIRMRHLVERALAREAMNGFLLQVILDYIHILISNAQVKILSSADDAVLQTFAFAPVNLYNRSAEAKDLGHQLVAISENYAGLLRPPANALSPLTWNYLCMTITAPVEQLELALGRHGPQSAPKARSAIEAWCKSPAARRAVLHAAQIFYILTNGVYSPLSSVDKILSRVESMVFTAALVLGLYFFTEGVSMSSSAMAGDSNPPRALELLQEIDWTVINGEGFTDQHSDWTMALDNAELYPSGKCTGVLARQFIRHGVVLASFDGDTQMQGTRTARRVFQECAYLLDQLGGYRGSGSDIANLARSVSDILGS